MLVPGLVSATFKNLDAGMVAKLASTAGLKAIEWSEGWHIGDGDVEKAAEVGRMTADLGLEVAAFGSYYRLGKGMDFSSRISTAKALGAKTVRIWAGDRPSAEVGADDRRVMVAEAARISSMAADNGLVVALEWHRNTLTDTNESGISFLKEVGMDNFRTLWQPTQALSVDERLQGLLDIGPRLVNLHVYHWNADGRLPLCEGSDEWLSYFGAVERKENHYALLEFVRNDSEAQFYEDAACLIGWLSASMAEEGENG